MSFNTTSPFTYLRHWYFRKSDGRAYETHDDANKYWTQWTENAPESRPYPDDLNKSITDRPMVYTRTSKPGCTGTFLYRKEDSTYTDRYSRIYANKFTGPYSDVTEPSLPDWSTALRLQIKDEAINLGTTLAEYRQSVNMFGNAARGVVNAWRSFRKLRPRKKLTMCSVASAELVYTYGVAPLVGDLYDSIERLQYRLQHPLYRKFHMRATDMNVSYVNRKYPVSGSYTPGGYAGRATWKKSQDVDAYVWYDIEKTANFIVGNPLELAWELVPYSFVVDWMIPIGDYLISLDALKAVKDVRVSVVTKDDIRNRYWVFGKDYYGNAKLGVDPKPMQTRERRYQRQTYSSIPFPALPKPSLSGSVRRLLNATSLLVNSRGCKGKTPRYTRGDFPA